MQPPLLQSSILHALARYRYLTNRQLSLICSFSTERVSRATALLSQSPKHAPLLLKRQYPVHTRFGRLETVYTLSRSGWKSIHPSLEVGRIRAPQMEHDYFHRLFLISFQIRLDQYFEEQSFGKVECFDRYFDSSEVSSPFSTKTRVSFPDDSFFIPDAIAVVNTGLARHLSTIEIVRGRNLRRTREQVECHMKAIASGVLSRKYALPTEKGYISLFVIEEKGLLSRLLACLQENPQFIPYRSHFLFALQKDTEHDVVKCWRRVGNTSSLHNFLTGAKSYRLPPQGS